MDCCIHLRCLLALNIVLNKPNFSRSSLRFPSAILDEAIPLDGWFVLSFEFGATALGRRLKPLPSYRRATAEPNSFEFGTAVARRSEQALKMTKDLCFHVSDKFSRFKFIQLKQNIT